MKSLLLCTVLLSWATTLAAQAPAALTLREALALAEEANPTLRAARAKLAAAEGESQEAASFFRENPELTLEGTRRQVNEPAGPGVRYRESAVGISQTLEIAGQPGHRREAARYALSATRAEIAANQVSMRAEVESAFGKVLLLQRRLRAEEENLELASNASAAAAKRVAAGEDSRLDGNLAAVEAGRARSQVGSVRDHLIEARGRLATLVQLAPLRLPEAVGELPEKVTSLSLDQLLAAGAERPELLALLEREAAAESRLRLEQAGTIPDITVGLTSAREGPNEFRERATTLSITVPLPFFKRNQAGIGRALMERDQARIEREAARRNGEAAVRELWQRLQVLEVRLRELTSAVVPRLDENVTLSRKAYQAGELGILQLVLVNRQSLDAQREYLEALGEFTQVRIALEMAAGVHRPDIATPGALRSSSSTKP